MPMHPKPMAETIRPLFPKSLRGNGVFIGADVALMSCPRSFRVRLATQARRAGVHRLCSLVGVPARSNELWQELSEPLPSAAAVYNGSGCFCSGEMSVAGGNSRARLKWRRKLPRILRDSAGLAQLVTQPAGHFLARAPYPRLESAARNAHSFARFVR